MDVSRRDLIRLGALMATGAALSGCRPAYHWLAETGFGSSQQLVLDDLPIDAALYQRMRRLTFGPRPAELRRAAEIGPENWIEEQLEPDLIDDTAASLRWRHLDTLGMKATDLVDRSDRIFDGQDRVTVPGELAAATLLRQVYSRRQLYELMVEFWTDHFSISVDKGDCWFLKTVDDRQVIRPYALGRYRDLLGASAHSPAMLVYLDNQSNQRGAPNENYARELLELHSLGVGGGYNQQDVMELARCLTGWTVKEHFWRGEFTFDDKLHDQEPKMFLGQQVLATGPGEVEHALDRLAAHPATAHYICGKLVRRFVADDPPQALVDKAARVFGRGDGDISAVLRVILLDGVAASRPKYKRPGHYVVSALRQLDADTDGGLALHEYLARMGQPFFGWPTPDGYPDQSDAWQGNLMPRWQFGLDLVQGQIPGTRVDLSRLAGAGGPGPGTVDGLGRLLTGAPLAEKQRDDLLATLKGAGLAEGDLLALTAAGLLASPAFMWR